MYQALREVTGIAIEPERNFFDGLQNADAWLTISGVLKAIALQTSKLAADLRLMSSGPRAGYCTSSWLPAVQPGSSIMPGKINPVVPEMIMQVYFRVLGQGCVDLPLCEGELELNVWESFLLNAASESAVPVRNAMRLFAERCVDGITANVDRCNGAARQSTALSTGVAMLFGYPLASEVAMRAQREGKTVQDTVIEMGVLSEADARRYLDPLVLTSPDQFHDLLESRLK
uniref:Putative muconate isomerase n=1 Tax=Pseudomonas sp. (strain CBS-3) TaxID=72586 RepID=A5JTM9_PSEUC|nr:putative muconate isomerase [Pseudomonas sp. CBS3]